MGERWQQTRFLIDGGIIYVSDFGNALIIARIFASDYCYATALFINLRARHD